MKTLLYYACTDLVYLYQVVILNDCQLLLTSVGSYLVDVCNNTLEIDLQPVVPWYSVVNAESGIRPMVLSMVILVNRIVKLVCFP